MLFGSLLLAAMLIALWRGSRGSRGRQRALDSHEIRIIRRLSDQIRKEQSQPFE